MRFVEACARCRGGYLSSGSKPQEHLKAFFPFWKQKVGHGIKKDTLSVNLRQPCTSVRNLENPADEQRRTVTLKLLEL